MLYVLIMLLVPRAAERQFVLRMRDVSRSIDQPHPVFSVGRAEGMDVVGLFLRVVAWTVTDERRQ